MELLFVKTVFSKTDYITSNFLDAVFHTFFLFIHEYLAQFDDESLRVTIFFIAR